MSRESGLVDMATMVPDAKRAQNLYSTSKRCRCGIPYSTVRLGTAKNSKKITNSREISPTLFHSYILAFHYAKFSPERGFSQSLDTSRQYVADSGKETSYRQQARI